VAIAQGTVKPQTIVSHLVRDRGDGRRGSTTNPAVGKRSVTHVTVHEDLGSFTLIECKLETGRTHQIRIHLAALGLTILGDKLYHSDENIFLEYYEQGATDWVKEQAGFYRLCLHAWSLEFRHPGNGREIVVSVPLAPEIYARMAQESEELVSALHRKLPSAAGTLGLIG
jgi:23S rRNA pseudouridine1911/1915/1917 synthase